MNFTFCDYLFIKNIDKVDNIFESFGISGISLQKVTTATRYLASRDACFGKSINGNK